MNVEPREESENIAPPKEASPAKQSAEETADASKSNGDGESAEPSEAQTEEEKSISSRTPRKKAAGDSASGDVKGRQSRVRKQVERFSVITSPKSSDEKTVVGGGSGTALGDIPLIESSIRKSKPMDLKTLHHACFGRVGTVSEVRSNLRKFNGFNFDKDSAEYKKREAAMNKKPVKELQSALRQLHLEVSGTRPVVVSRLLEFLLKPAAAVVKYKGKLPPSKRKSAAGRKSEPGMATPKRGRKSSSSAAAAAATTPKKVKKVESDDDDDDEEASSSEQEEEEEEEEEQSDKEGSQLSDISDTKGTKKKGTQKPAKDEKASKDEEDEDEPSEEEEKEADANDYKPKGGAGRKRRSTAPTPKSKRRRVVASKEEEEEDAEESKSEEEEEEEKQLKSRAKKVEEEQEEEEKEDEKEKKDDEDEDDKPLSSVMKPKAGAFPTDEELKTKVLELLKTVNLNETTMKEAREQVAKQYPNVNLEEKKQFINDVIKGHLADSAQQ